MTLAAEKIYTPEDLVDDPNLAGFELVDGRLKERPVSERSCAVSGKIYWLLLNEAMKTREATVYPAQLGYDCFSEFSKNLRFPDVSLIRASHKTEIGENPSYISIPADLVVEVLSPRDRVKEIDDKIKAYLGAGFNLVWVVNPDWRHVTIYRRDGSIQLLNEQDEITGEAALPDFRCKVGAFFDI